jgi:hypothetical protein
MVIAVRFYQPYLSSRRPDLLFLFLLLLLKYRCLDVSRISFCVRFQKSNFYSYLSVSLLIYPKILLIC